MRTIRTISANDILKSERTVHSAVASTPVPTVGPLAVALLVAAALLVALVVAGTWPPLVAVESGSMEPTLERGDLVVVTATDRFPSDGTVGSGDVVVFSPPAHDGAPILHRVAFAVEAGEDWTERGDPDLIDGDCATLRHCPAPHDGYVTYGDANGEYDQSAGLAPIVRADWIDSRAVASASGMGWPRIALDAVTGRFGAAGALAVGGSVAFAGGFVAVLVGRIRDRG